MAKRKLPKQLKDQIYKRVKFHEYKVNKNVKGVLYTRLRDEGNWGLFNRLRETLVNHGVPRNVAWKVAGAAFPRPEDDGRPHELSGDSAYAKIQAGWANGQYPIPPELEKRPDGTTTHKLKEPASPELAEAIKQVKEAPAKFEAAWDKLTREVGKRRSTSHEEDLRWIVENYRAKPADIDPADVPSRAALSQLRHATDSVAHFGDIQKQYSAMQNSNAKSQQGRSRFKDDGRSLELIENFKKALDAEGVPPLPEKSSDAV